MLWQGKNVLTNRRMKSDALVLIVIVEGMGFAVNVLLGTEKIKASQCA